MRISKRHQFIFFANPRTGSESMRALLDLIRGVQAVSRLPGRLLHDHMRPLEARPLFLQMGWDFDRCYRFVTVRNPWRRLASVYAMAQAINEGALPPFPAWLENTRPDGPGGGGNGNGEQLYLKYGTYSLSAFAGDGQGNLMVHDVFRMEDFGTLPSVLRQRGVPIPKHLGVPHYNFTRGTVDYRRLYTDKAIELVRRRYAEDIERFGYEFPTGTYDAPKVAMVPRIKV